MLSVASFVSCISKAELPLAVFLPVYLYFWLSVPDIDNFGQDFMGFSHLYLQNSSNWVSSRNYLCENLKLSKARSRCSHESFRSPVVRWQNPARQRASGELG